MGREHRQHKGMNSRDENSRQPTRRRERQRTRIKDPAQFQRFPSIRDPIVKLFHLRREHCSVAGYRKTRARAFRVWDAGAPLVA